MSQLWRELYRQLSLFGGFIALLLTQVTGASISLEEQGKQKWTELFLPQMQWVSPAPAPVRPACEKKLGEAPRHLADMPDWCDSQAKLTNQKTETALN